MINAAYKLPRQTIGASVTSVYDRIKNVLLDVVHCLLLVPADRSREVHASARDRWPSPAPGVPVWIVDDNRHPRNERRLKPLRDLPDPLPSASLVVYYPGSQPSVDIISCKDGCRGQCDIVLESITTSVIAPAVNRRSFETNPNDR